MARLSTSLLVPQINFQCTPLVPPLPTGQRMPRHLSNYAYTPYVDRGRQHLTFKPLIRADSASQS